MMENAYAQTVRDEDDNGWVIYDNNGERITVLPQPCDEHTAMAAIRLARQVEVDAYNRGYKLARDAQDHVLNAQNDFLKGQLRSLEAMNERLSEQLERHIEG